MTIKEFFKENGIKHIDDREYVAYRKIQVGDLILANPSRIRAETKSKFFIDIRLFQKEFEHLMFVPKFLTQKELDKILKNIDVSY